MRLVSTVFVAVVPALTILYFLGLNEWGGFLVGLVALGAAWFGGEKFVMRQVRVLLDATQRLAKGDLSSRTNLGHAKGESCHEPATSAIFDDGSTLRPSGAFFK